VLDEDTFLCNPGGSLSPDITRITGLRDSDLAEQLPFAARVPQLRTLFAAADALIAHNLPFDAFILAHELRLAGALRSWPWPPLRLCTAQLHEELWGFRPRLVQLYAHIIGRPYPQTHRALDDARALRELLVAEGCERSIAELLLAGAPPPRAAWTLADELQAAP
jgi:DNA polymerase III epsilon subunit-like protein